MSCNFCYNAHVWAKEPHTEEDYFDDGLNNNNDSSAVVVGSKTDGFQIFLNSGGGEAVNIELCQWQEKGYRGQPGWSTIGVYYPKFCPECGRKLDEYKIDERGASYKKVDCTQNKLPYSLIDTCPACGVYTSDGEVCICCQKKYGIYKPKSTDEF